MTGVNLRRLCGAGAVSAASQRGEGAGAGVVMTRPHPHPALDCPRYDCRLSHVSSILSVDMIRETRSGCDRMWMRCDAARRRGGSVLMAFFDDTSNIFGLWPNKNEFHFFEFTIRFSEKN